LGCFSPKVGIFMKVEQCELDLYQNKEQNINILIMADIARVER
jgi:hypothetical protein